MDNKIKQQINKIEIPNELHQRSRIGVQKAKSEMQNSRRKWSKFIAVAASLLIIFGGYSFLQKNMEQVSPGNDSIVRTEDGGLRIPAIKLPENTANANMIGLIVYNGKIYTQTATEIDVQRAKDLLGEKLGRTKGNIDEWSKQDEYAIEFASSIGEVDVYTVKGYDKDFRIMTYTENDGKINSEFYECLNGITVYDGGDIFGKLKMVGNIANAKYQIYTDWYHSVDQFYPINNIDLLNTFAEELNRAIPHSRQNVEREIGNFRNNEKYRRISVQLNDGSKVNLIIIKDGYVYYGHTTLYFKIDGEIFTKVWNALESHRDSQ